MKLLLPLIATARKCSGWLTQTLRTLSEWPWFETLRTLRERFREDRLSITAGSLTFTTLLALVPLLTVMLALFTAFPIFSQFQDALQKYFLYSLVPGNIAQPVLGALNAFASKAHQLGTASLLALLASAVLMMLTMDQTLNAIWRVRKPRPLAQRVLVYWAAITLGPLLLGGSLTMTSYALTASKGWVLALPGGVAALIRVLEFTLVAAAMAALFHYVPNTWVQWRHAWAGGLFVAIGLEMAKNVLGWYFSKVTSYATIYGAFATAPIFLIWLYTVWAIVLLGAVVAAYAPSLKMRVVRQTAQPGQRFALALQIIGELAAARVQDRRGLSLADLARRLRIDPLQIEPVIDDLMAIQWAGRLDEAGSQRYVLLCDPGRTAAKILLDALLLRPEARVAAFRRRAEFEQMTLAELLPPP